MKRFVQICHRFSSLLVAPLLTSSLVACLPPSLSGLGASTSTPAVTPPNITVKSVTLTRHPSPATVARALCDQVVSSMVCMALGDKPSPAEMAFDFNLALDVANPAPTPVPMVDALVAFTAFPDVAQGGQHLGAVCVSLQNNGAPPATGSPAPCSGGGASIHSMSDFASSAVGFLTKAAAGQASAADLAVQTVPAGGQLTVNVALSLAPDQVLNLILGLEKQALTDIAKGSSPALTIPFSIQGSAWVNIGTFGSVGANFGPVKNSFSL